MTEMEETLRYLNEKIVSYVKDAESNKQKVTQLFDPNALQKLQEQEFTVGPKGQGLEMFKKFTDFLLENSVATWNPRFMEKLYAGTNPVGVATDMLLSVLNTNSHVFTASPALTVIEKYIARKYAAKFGFTGPTAGGLTFPGGSYSNITSMHLARATLFPETKEQGNVHRFALFTSEHSHYSLSKSAILLGMGSASVYKVKVQDDGRMDVSDLLAKIEQAKSDGRTPFYINATAGTTVYGSFDPIDEIATVSSKYGLWLHVDGSWGGNVIFSAKQAHKLKGSHLAQSITVNPHKMLGVPCTCSFLLVPKASVFVKANSMAAEYLFHGNDEDETENADVDDNFDLANGTMACGRRADALKLFTAWQWYGSDGFAERVDYAFEMTAYLSDKIHKNPNLQLLTPVPPPCLQTCFFFAPDGQLRSSEETSALTRRITMELRRQSKFLIDYTPHPEKGEFFRVVLNSPSVTKALLDDLVDTIVRLGLEFR